MVFLMEEDIKNQYLQGFCPNGTSYHKKREHGVHLPYNLLLQCYIHPVNLYVVPQRDGR